MVFSEVNSEVGSNFAVASNESRIQPLNFWPLL